MMSCCEQDWVVVVASYPNNLNPVESFNAKTDFDLQGNVWCGMCALNSFFNCTLCPTGAKVESSAHKEKCPWCISARMNGVVWYVCPQIF